ARHAAAGLVQRIGLVEAPDDLVEGGAPPLGLELGLDGARRVGVVPGVELVEGDDLVLRRGIIGPFPQPGVDVAGRGVVGCYGAPLPTVRRARVAARAAALA